MLFNFYFIAGCERASTSSRIPVVEYPGSASILKTSGLEPVSQRASLRGIAAELVVYEIP